MVSALRRAPKVSRTGAAAIGFRTEATSAASVKVTVARVPRPNVAQSIEVPSGASIADVVRQVGAHPDQVIVIRNELPVPLDAAANEGDLLRLVNVFSGG